MRPCHSPQCLGRAVPGSLARECLPLPHLRPPTSRVRGLRRTSTQVQASWTGWRALASTGRQRQRVLERGGHALMLCAQLRRLVLLQHTVCAGLPVRAHAGWNGQIVERARCRKQNPGRCGHACCQTGHYPPLRRAAPGRERPPRAGQRALTPVASWTLTPVARQRLGRWHGR